LLRKLRLSPFQTVFSLLALLARMAKVLRATTVGPGRAVLPLLVGLLVLVQPLPMRRLVVVLRMLPLLRMPQRLVQLLPGATLKRL